MSDAKKKRQRVVVKIGTNLLADKEAGIHAGRIQHLAGSVSRLKALGKDIAIVSSGAIGAGVAALGLPEKPRTIPGKQATAAIGQPLLMEAYERAFRTAGLHIAQILLTKDDLVNRGRFLNAKHTFAALFEKGVVPVINENDTVAVEEIKLGDNDNLAAMVAHLMEADLLVILTGTEGLYTADPAADPGAELIPVVERITPQIERMARRSGTELGTGGMQTKIQAAKRCVSAGIAMMITNGMRPEALEEALCGQFKGTLFLPRISALNVRKKWIGFVSHAKGSVIVDEGARSALLTRQKSLLPSGIIAVQGEFKVHDTISVKDPSGSEIARGVSCYASADLLRIKGKKSAEIRKMLTVNARDEVIHKDNLVIMGE